MQSMEEQQQKKNRLQMWLYTFYIGTVIHIFTYIQSTNNIIKRKITEYGWFVQCTVTHIQIYTSTNINNFNKQQ